MILGLGCPATCGGLWRAVAGCGGLWRAVAACGGKLWPLYTTMLGPWGLQAGRMVSGRLAGWLDGWMAGWKAGWMAGWLDGGHHSCNLARSMPKGLGESLGAHTCACSQDAKDK